MRVHKTRNLLLLILIFLIFSSCSDDNGIYFDMKNQSINTCGGSVIHTFSINCMNQEVYRFHLNDKERGTDKFYLEKINKGYQDYIIHWKPNTEYIISHDSYRGIAPCHLAPCRLILRTDSVGKVIYADKTDKDWWKGDKE